MHVSLKTQNVKKHLKKREPRLKQKVKQKGGETKKWQIGDT